MEKEFNLSEKENETLMGNKCYWPKHIKEAVKRLKAGTKLRQMRDGYPNIDFIFNNFIEDIDKIFGDKLI